MSQTVIVKREVLEKILKELQEVKQMVLELKAKKPASQGSQHD
jgi:hypothetical protein